MAQTTLYITQKDGAKRWGCTTAAISQRRKRHGDDFPIPLAGAPA